ncbi:DNA cytosine methyltransferase [Limnohabitans sp. DM1]|uniref:DNA cytosine methyltransferase n=1 Tax=Limnohabitans sp. DM1 TaxID=1597955 RepID=UPI000A762CD8|nr:DNA cytosine methyltransferase [Limnohabitans sp. DM1]
MSKKNGLKPLKLVSLFSGGGGLDLGLEAAGFETVFATDIDHHSCETLKKGKEKAAKLGKPFLSNAVIHEADILSLSSNLVMEKANLKPGETDLLAGGPPCQAFSVFGKRLGIKDPRGQLPQQYIRLLSELQPKSFVFENVFGLLTIHGGETFKELCEILSNPSNDLSYEISVHRLNASDYGVPQSRDRVFIIGTRIGKSLSNIPPLCFDEKKEDKDKTHLRKRTVGDAFKGLPPLGEKLANHYGREHSQRIIDRYESLIFGERDHKTRINRLDPNRPSYTIIVGSDKGGGKGHVHPHEPREVSPRESARIQTFPDWWDFSGTSRHPIRQIGNAVPPILAAVIGREIASNFFNHPKKPLKEIVDLLSQNHLFKEDISDV